MPKKIVTHRVIVTPPARPACEEDAEAATVVVTPDDQLRALARRCGELLVEKADPCPPGHWLG